MDNLKNNNQELCALKAKEEKELSSCACELKPDCTDEINCNCTDEINCNCTDEKSCSCTDEKSCSCTDEANCNCGSEEKGQSGGGFFAAMRRYIKGARLELIIIALVVAVDLVTKLIVQSLMEEGQVNVVIRNFLQIHYCHNDKAAFGSAFGLERLLGAEGTMIFFIVFSFITICAFCYMLFHFRNGGLLVRVALALVIGGAFGNLYDRMAFGYVRDFVEFVFFGYDVPLLGPTFAIFNIADAALVIGMIVLMYFFILVYKPPKKEEKILEK